MQSAAQQAAIAAIAQLSAKMAMPKDEAPKVRPDLVSVASLQAKILTAEQLDGIAHIQEAIMLIAELESRVNRIAIGCGLSDVKLFLAEVGLLAGKLENKLFDSGVAAAKLRNGQEAAKIAGRAAA